MDIFHLVLSGYANLYYNFTNLAFVTSSLLFCIEAYRVFSHDVKAAILVSQNNETAAMLVFQTNPVGGQLLSSANAFFCYNKFA